MTSAPGRCSRADLGLFALLKGVKARYAGLDLNTRVRPCPYPPVGGGGVKASYAGLELNGLQAKTIVADSYSFYTDPGPA